MWKALTRIEVGAESDSLAMLESGEIWVLGGGRQCTILPPPTPAPDPALPCPWALVSLHLVESGKLLPSQPPYGGQISSVI